jgi:hypothetical protein
MIKRGRQEKLKQLLQFRSDHEMTNAEFQAFLAISEAPFKRWVADMVEIPDSVSIALEMYESGEMPPPSSVVDIDRNRVVWQTKNDLGATDKDLSEATGSSAGTIRHWRQNTSGQIKPAALIAFAGLVKRRYGYDALKKIRSGGTHDYETGT